jgi:hypothetical protein
MQAWPGSQLRAAPQAKLPPPLPVVVPVVVLLPPVPVVLAVVVLLLPPLPVEGWLLPQAPSAALEEAVKRREKKRPCRYRLKLILSR